MTDRRQEKRDWARKNWKPLAGVFAGFGLFGLFLGNEIAMLGAIAGGGWLWWIHRE